MDEDIPKFQWGNWADTPPRASEASGETAATAGGTHLTAADLALIREDAEEAIEAGWHITHEPYVVIALLDALAAAQAETATLRQLREQEQQAMLTAVQAVEAERDEAKERYNNQVEAYLKEVRRNERLSSTVQPLRDENVRLYKRAEQAECDFAAARLQRERLRELVNQARQRLYAMPGAIRDKEPVLIVLDAALADPDTAADAGVEG